LVEYAWGHDESDVLLKTHVCHMRRKLPLPRSGLGDIVAVPGVGYRLTKTGHRSPPRLHVPYYC